MSVLNFLTKRLLSEADLDLGGLGDDEEDISVDKKVDITKEDPAPEEESSVEGDPKALVDALIKYAPGKEKQIKNMLKYAANSDEEYDIFDSAYDYYESIEDGLGADEQSTDDVPPADDIPVDDEPALDKEVPADDELDLSGIGEGVEDATPIGYQKIDKPYMWISTSFYNKLQDERKKLYEPRLSNKPVRKSKNENVLDLSGL